MQKLMSELIRLYLTANAVSPERLSQHLRGEANLAVKLSTDDGLTRAIVIPFEKTGGGEDAGHWDGLCAVANALQAALGFPAPAVSISGDKGYRLWLSLAQPIPVAQARQFLALLRQAYFPDMAWSADAATGAVALPPCLHQVTGRWAAFIHPGMGASFADEAGLEMAPPLAGQVAFLEGLQSIAAAQFQQAMGKLDQSGGTPPADSVPAPHRAGTQDGLLLRDATLEDIVRFLHSKNIEPTFRHLITA